MDNCTGLGAITKTLFDDQTITVSIEQVDGSKVSAEGTVNIGAFGSVGLGAEIAKQYGLTYGASNTVHDGQEVTAPAGSRTEYVSETRKLYETGEITLAQTGTTQSFPYEILTGIKVNATSKDLGCPQTSESPTASPSATPTTFLGALQGRWKFQTWQERPGIKVLGMKPLDGTLVFDAFGHAYWDLTLDDGGPKPALTPAVRCVGAVDDAAETLAAWSGKLKVDGEDVIRTERDWTANLRSLAGDVETAFCGSTLQTLSTYETTPSDYALRVTTAGDGSTRVLTMRNDSGTFSWTQAG